MKILHTSDIHLGSPMTAHLDPIRAATRRRELEDCFARTVEYAVAEGVSGFIIAGDLFDSQTVSRRTIEAALATIAGASGITFFYLPGNHEGDILSGYAGNLPDNLRIFGKDWTYFSLGGVTLAGRSSVCEGMLDTLTLGDGRRNIVVLHGELRDRTAAPDVIGVLDARARNIDYLALGHYHSYSAREIERGGYAVYCGAPAGRGFDEVGECGFVMIEVGDKALSHRFVPLSGRAHRIISADISGCESRGDIEKLCIGALSSISRDDLVRLVLTGTHSADLVRDTEGIRRKFAKEFFYFEACDESTLKISAEDYKYDRSLRGEFVRSVMGDTSLDDAERTKILECGLAALSGEATYDW